MTSSTALVLLVLLAIEGVTVLKIHSLLTIHVFVGMLLIPPVLVKLASTTWRFMKYYLGSPDYRRHGPPAPVLRVLGPFIVVLTVILFASGVYLLVGPVSLRAELLRIHQVSFVLWFIAMTVHVLGHLGESTRLGVQDWARRTRRAVAGSLLRRRLLTSSIVVGVVLGVITIPYVGPWILGK